MLDLLGFTDEEAAEAVDRVYGKQAMDDAQPQPDVDDEPAAGGEVQP